MGEDKWKNKVYNNWKILCKTGENLCTAKCLICKKDFKEMNLANIVHGYSKCCKVCSVKVRKQKALEKNKKDYIGSDYNYWHILDFIDNATCIARCTLCEEKFERKFSDIKSGKSICCKKCSNKLQSERSLEKKSVKYEGKDFIDWKIIKVIDSVNCIVLCKLCNKTYERKLQSILEGELGCCVECYKKKLSEKSSKLGMELKSKDGYKAIIIKEIEGGRVVLSFLDDNTEKEYSWNHIRKEGFYKKSINSTTDYMSNIYYTKDGFPFRIESIEFSKEKHQYTNNLIFLDGTKKIKKGSTSSILKKANYFRKDKRGYFSSFYISDLAYKLNEVKDCFYFCSCNKCGLHDILTPDKMLEHKCKEEY